jgi:hypothetical protein
MRAIASEPATVHGGSCPNATRRQQNAKAKGMCKKVIGLAGCRILVCAIGLMRTSYRDL